MGRAATRPGRPAWRRLAVMAIAAVATGAVASCAHARGCGAAGGQGPGARPVAVEYEVILREPQTQVVEFAVTAPTGGRESIDFVLPAWRPGRYAIIDPAGTVRRVRASGPGGEDLAVEKVDKATWRVDTRAHASGEPRHMVRFEYSLYANSLSDRTRHVDETHAFLSGSSVFVYSPELRAEPVRVRIDAPDGWRTATGLEADPGDAGAFLARDYDVLVDSPLEIGVHESFAFDVDGLPHEVALWGDAEYDAEELAEDLAAIVREQRDLFGGGPYERYVFIIHVAPGLRGGTEHLNSTVMQAGPGAFEKGRPYRDFLGLASHEFFHTWNVKQFRPAEIHPYEYTRENYTRSLWIVEGTTSYYDDLILVRAGLHEVKDYLKAQAEAIDALTRRPGRLLQSLEESSHDAWIKFNRPTPDSVNSTVSFYMKGALVSMLLDMEIRRRSGGRASLDDVMRAMYREFPLAGPGYTPDHFRRVAERLAGADLGEFFARFVAGTDDLPLAEALAVVGLELTRDPGDDDDPDGPQAYIGLDVTERGGLAVVDAVRSDGPAYAAGVNAGDEIVAMNGRRLRAGDLSKRLEKLAPGDPVRLTILRRDVLREVEFAAAERERGSLVLRRVEDPTPEQKAAYRSWLGRAWPGDEIEDDPEEDNP